MQYLDLDGCTGLTGKAKEFKAKELGERVRATRFLNPLPPFVFPPPLASLLRLYRHTTGL
jgi:hypothetical protein